MKKPTSIIISIIATTVVIVGIVIIEKHNKTPIERYTETSSTLNIYVNDEQIVSESSQPCVNHVVVNNFHTVEYEFLSYEIVDDVYIDDQTEYNAEFYYEGHIPDPDYNLEYIDYPQMRSDYPAVDEYITSNGNSGMTAAEYQSFLEQHLSEYTSIRHPHTQYVFVHCRLTNITNGSIDEYVNMLSIVGVRNSVIVGMGEFTCYYDASQHTEGEDRIHHFFLYSFHESGESIECVIGCELREDYFDLSEDNQYYIGFIPIGLESYEQFDPSIDEGFVALDSLRQES